MERLPYSGRGLAAIKKRLVNELEKTIARRTAFLSRFIVLREGRRSRAHRMIEELCWNDDTSAEQLSEMFRAAFKANGDKMQPVERDLKRALAHADRSVSHFVGQYLDRATQNFRDALVDYDRSNKLLFGDNPEDVPRSGGWRIPDRELPEPVKPRNGSGLTITQ